MILETCDDLAPGGKSRKLSKVVLKSGGEKVGLIGHMPHLDNYAAWLLGEKRIQIDIAKAGVVLLTCGEAPGKGLAALQWAVTPDWY